VVEAVEFASLNTDLPIDPYTLGALLGDGHFGNNLVMAGSARKAEVRERIEQVLPAGYRISGGTDHYLLTAVAAGSDKLGHGGPGTNRMLAAIRELGLGGTRSDTKRIPPMYLRASVAERKELLRGLMDTDGTGTKVASAEYATISEGLAIDIAELVRSLGGLARIRETIPYKGANNTIFRVSVRTPFNPFHLARKRERYEARPKQPFVRYIVGYEPIGDRKECVCIQVANADCLYVTQDYVLTHNTFAINFLRGGGNVLSLREMLGHESLAIVQRYVAIAQADIARQHALYSPVAQIFGTKIGRGTRVRNR
jgi:hypothetical protein